MTERLSDPGLLLPSVQERLDWALRLVRADGFHPLVFETRRSKSRAADLARRGTGSADSMHIYGAAVDVVCAYHLWNCRHHGCGFFPALGRAAEDVGMVWGGRWKSRPDSPHIQAVPVRLQARFRALPEAERDAFAAACMRGEEP